MGHWLSLAGWPLTDAHVLALHTDSLNPQRGFTQNRIVLKIWSGVGILCRESRDLNPKMAEEVAQWAKHWSSKHEHPPDIKKKEGKKEKERTKRNDQGRRTVLANSNQGRMGQGRAMNRPEGFKYKRVAQDTGEILDAI